MKRARQLEQQGGTISVFLKRAKNKWEYQGEYDFVALDTGSKISPKDVSSVKRVVRGVIHLREIAVTRI